MLGRAVHKSLGDQPVSIALMAVNCWDERREEIEWENTARPCFDIERTTAELLNTFTKAPARHGFSSSKCADDFEDDWPSEESTTESEICGEAPAAEGSSAVSSLQRVLRYMRQRRSSADSLAEPMEDNLEESAPSLQTECSGQSSGPAFRAHAALLQSSPEKHRLQSAMTDTMSPKDSMECKEIQVATSPQKPFKTASSCIETENIWATSVPPRSALDRGTCGSHDALQELSDPFVEGEGTDGSAQTTNRLQKETVLEMSTHTDCNVAKTIASNTCAQSPLKASCDQNSCDHSCHPGESFCASPADDARIHFQADEADADSVLKSHKHSTVSCNPKTTHTKSGLETSTLKTTSTQGHTGEAPNTMAPAAQADMLLPWTVGTGNCRVVTGSSAGQLLLEAGGVVSKLWRGAGVQHRSGKARILALLPKTWLSQLRATIRSLGACVPVREASQGGGSLANRLKAEAQGPAGICVTQPAADLRKLLKAHPAGVSARPPSAIAGLTSTRRRRNVRRQHAVDDDDSGNEDHFQQKWDLVLVHMDAKFPDGNHEEIKALLENSLGNGAPKEWLFLCEASTAPSDIPQCNMARSNLKKNAPITSDVPRKARRVASGRAGKENTLPCASQRDTEAVPVCAVPAPHPNPNSFVH